MAPGGVFKGDSDVQYRESIGTHPQTSHRGSEARIDRLAFQSKHTEYALVYPAQRLAAYETLQCLDAQSEVKRRLGETTPGVKRRLFRGAAATSLPAWDAEKRIARPLVPDALY